MEEHELRQEYLTRYETYLKPWANKLTDQLQDHLNGVEHIDRISARAKAVESFVAKAMKAIEGNKKYSQPFEQIQDLVAARVIVFYKQDVEVIEHVIRRYYQPVEARELIPERDNAFGYVGKHLILAFPSDFYPDSADKAKMPVFFELQIKTLFQHAWSEAAHDLAYKPHVELTSLQNRMIAFTAAQSWGADQQFAQLHAELNRAPPAQ